MRKYEIREEGDGFVFECVADPVEVTKYGWISGIILRQLSEQDAHKAGAFVRLNEDAPMESLYERTEAHIGRAPA